MTDEEMRQALAFVEMQSKGEYSRQLLIEAAEKIRFASLEAISIDNLIHAHEDPLFTKVAKLCIAKCIHAAERLSKYYKSSHNLYNDIEISLFEEVWMNGLTKLMCEGVTKSRVHEAFENLTIVNFNYDRCVEQYLQFSIPNYFQIDQQVVRELLNDGFILHPYGVAGRLPWVRGNGAPVQFGGGNHHELVEAACEIKTFTEGASDRGTVVAIRHAIQEAERIIFLGFGFHRQDLELISGECAKEVTFLATAFGVSDSDKHEIVSDICRCIRPKDAPTDRSSVKITDVSCASLFKNYWRTLTSH